jgi:hypothetical protein
LNWHGTGKEQTALLNKNISIPNLNHTGLMMKFDQNLISSGWKPIHLTSVFSLRTSVLSLPDGTTLMAFTDVNMDVADVR